MLKVKNKLINNFINCSDSYPYIMLLYFISLKVTGQSPRTICGLTPPHHSLTLPSPFNSIAYRSHSQPSTTYNIVLKRAPLVI